MVLHDFDKFNLESFLPFMKFLLSGLYNHNSTGAISGATLVKNQIYSNYSNRTVFVIGSQDTTQNSVFDEGKLPM